MDVNTLVYTRKVYEYAVSIYLPDPTEKNKTHVYTMQWGSEQLPGISTINKSTHNNTYHNM